MNPAPCGNPTKSVPPLQAVFPGHWKPSVFVTDAGLRVDCINKTNQKKRRQVKTARRKNGKPNKARSRPARAAGLDPCILELGRSVSDPWSFSSCIPDGSHGTGKFSIMQTSTITTGVGNACAYFLSCSSHNNYAYADSGNGAATITVGGNWVAATNTAAIVALYARTRLVSAGIRVGYIGTTTNDSGVLLVGQVPATVSPASFNGKDLGGVSALCQYYKVIPARQGATIAWRPCDYDDQGAFAENAATGSTATQALVPRPYLVVCAFGIATAGAGSLLIESVTNWEGQFINPTFSPGGISNRGGASSAVVGWYEKVQNLTSTVAPIAAAVVRGLWQLNSAASPTRLLTRGGPIVEEVD